MTPPDGQDTGAARPRGATMARAKHELREFLLITAYLYVGLGAITLLKFGILRGQGVSYLPIGFALIKAAVLAKFAMLGAMMRLGDRYRSRPLIWPTLHKSIAFMILLSLLTIVEEIVVALIHGRPVSGALAEFVGVHMAESAARIVILGLILIPFFAVRSLADALGEDRLYRLFFLDRRLPELRQDD